MYFNIEINILDLIQFWMWKSAYVGVYQLLNWKMHGEILKFVNAQQAKPYNIYKNTKLKGVPLNIFMYFNIEINISD